MSGGVGDSEYLSSTELLVETASAWIMSADLPSPRLGLRGANIDNKILMTGYWTELTDLLTLVWN